MNPLFAARRRAEEFDSLIEDTSIERCGAAYAELLEVVGQLRRTAPVEPRADFVADLRERLMIAADSALAPATDAQVAARRSVPPRRTTSERRLATAIGGFAIVGATASMAVAAQSALPGDTLYPLKRAIENAQTGVQMDNDDKGASLLASASGRLAEIDELSRSDEDAGAEIAETLQSFADQATAASDLLLADYRESGRTSSVDELRSFTSDSMQSLSALEALVPIDARSSLIQAAQTLTQIDQQAISLCPSCGEGAVTELPRFAAASAEDLIDLVEGVAVPTPERNQSVPPDRQAPDKGEDEGKDEGKDEGSDDGRAPDRSELDDSGSAGQPSLPTGGKGSAGSNGDVPDGDTSQGPLKDLADGLTGGGKDEDTVDGPGLDDALKGANATVDGQKDQLAP